MDGFEHFNATVRWTVARSRLYGIDTLIFLFPKEKKNANESVLPLLDSTTQLPQPGESVCWITAAVRGRALPMRTDLKKCNRIRPPPSGFCEEPPWPSLSRANPSVRLPPQSVGAHCVCNPILKKKLNPSSPSPPNQKSKNKLKILQKTY